MTNTIFRSCLLAVLLTFLCSCGDLAEAIADLPTNNDTHETSEGETTPSSDEADTPRSEGEMEEVSFLTAVPDGYELFQPDGEPQTVFADFNGDGAEDAATMIVGIGKEQDEDTRLIAIISHRGDPFVKTQMSKNLGDVGSSSELLTVEGDVLILHHTWMRAVGQYKFRYERKYGDFRIIGKEYEGFGNAVHEGAGTTSINFLAGKYERMEKKAVTDDEGNVLSYTDAKKTGTVSTDLVSLSDMEEETWFVQWF